MGRGRTAYLLRQLETDAEERACAFAGDRPRQVERADETTPGYSGMVASPLKLVSPERNRSRRCGRERCASDCRASLPEKEIHQAITS
jgi:hypothetical protein